MRFSDISWTKDGKGFFYSRYPEPPKNKVLEAALADHALYYHRVGTPQSQDVLVYERKDLPSWIVNGVVSEDGRYLFVLMFQGADNKNRLYYADLGNPMAPEDQRAGACRSRVGRCGVPAVRHQRFHAVRAHRQERAEPGGAVHRCWARRERRPGRPSSPSARRRSRASAFIGGRVVAQYLVDVQSRLSMFGPTARRSATSRCRAPAPWAAISGRERCAGRLVRASRRRWRPPRSIASIRRRHRAPVRGGDAAGRRERVRDAGAVRHVEGRDARAALRDREEGPGPRRQQPDDGLRLRRVLGERAAGLPAGRARVARARRHLGDREPARRRRVRRGLAPGRHARAQAERLRRLHRRAGVPGAREVHVAGAARHHGRFERRPARGRRDGRSGRI